MSRKRDIITRLQIHLAGKGIVNFDSLIQYRKRLMRWKYTDLVSELNAVLSRDADGIREYARANNLS